MNESVEQTKQTNPTNAVRIERVFDAPIETIWAMWTDPEHFKAWYGPHGASIPVAEFELRVGGIRRVCMEMQTPKGAMRMWFTGEHRVVEPLVRLVYSEAMCDEDGNVIDPREMGMPGEHPITEITVTFEDLGNQTRMILVHAGIPSDSPGAIGWNMALDKLAQAIKH